MSVTAHRLPLARARGIDPYWWFVAPLAAFLLLLYVAPMAWILSLSVTEAQENWYDNFAAVLGGENIHRMMWTTVRIVGLTTLISLVLGYVLAYAAVHMGPRQRLALMLAVVVPFWLSVLVRAFSWLILLRNNGLVNQAIMGLGLSDQPLPMVRNELGVVIGMVHYLVPYAFFPLYSAMSQMDQRVLMASRALGAGALRTFWRVFLPLTRPALFGAAVIVFVFGLGFFVTPAILGGGRVVIISEFVSIRVLQTLDWGLASALSLVLLAATLALIVAAARVVDLRRMLGGG
ncbi:ABC transporter permease [Zavarzinia sp. CC-PAN008]|uniref:ABC transporter permease n=1 Tax=Zavarzinia sp. CC-PAN008 TaxID=3243332 RepID=UPI003F7484C4